MADLHLVGCSRCKGKTEISTMKYNNDGKLICYGCYEQVFLKPKEQAQQGTAPKTALEAHKEKHFNTEREKYICTMCRYKFSLRRDSLSFRKCPYCNSAQVAPDKASMRELVKVAV